MTALILIVIPVNRFHGRRSRMFAARKNESVIIEEREKEKYMFLCRILGICIYAAHESWTLGLGFETQTIFKSSMTIESSDVLRSQESIFFKLNTSTAGRASPISASPLSKITLPLLINSVRCASVQIPFVQTTSLSSKGTLSSSNYFSIR